MAKYIDADKLKAEIERRFSEYNHDLNHHIQAAECASILDFVDSLQQEQFSDDLEEAAEKYRRESYNKAMLPNIDGPMPEYGGNVKDAFKAGAEWMKDAWTEDDKRIRNQIFDIMKHLGCGIAPIPDNIEEILQWLLFLRSRITNNSDFK